MIAGVSSTPRAFCRLVPAAGIMPEDIAVDPLGDGSRSSTSTSAPASCAAKAATRPQAPPPITSTGTERGNSMPAAGRTLLIAWGSCRPDQRHCFGAGQCRRHRAERSDAGLMSLLTERGTAIGQQKGMEVAHMGIPQRAGDTAIGDDTADQQGINAGFAQ